MAVGGLEVEPCTSALNRATARPETEAIHAVMPGNARAGAEGACLLVGGVLMVPAQLVTSR
jgi:hypothetical protein